MDQRGAKRYVAKLSRDGLVGLSLRAQTAEYEAQPMRGEPLAIAGWEVSVFNPQPYCDAKVETGACPNAFAPTI